MWSYDAFLAEGELLVERARRRRALEGDAETVSLWEWREGRRPHLLGNAYLVSRDNLRVRRNPRKWNGATTASSQPPLEGELNDINALLLLEHEPRENEDRDSLVHGDGSSLVQDATSDSSEAVLYEFHIVFHAVYETPVLYFRLSQLDGAPVAFDESFARELRLPGGNERATLVAMEEHQVLGAPFYFLHPCETASAMALLLDQPSHQPDHYSGLGDIAMGSNNKGGGVLAKPTYLLAWLSLVQPLTHINPLKY